MLNSMFAESALPVVHCLGQLVGRTDPDRVTGLWQLVELGPGRDRRHAGDLLSDPPVDDLGHRLGIFELP